MSITQETKNCKKINRIDQTNDALTSRAGLAAIAQFLQKMGVPRTLAQTIPIKKHAKGASDQDIFQQLLMFFIDGTYHELTGFDQLKLDTTWLDICAIEQGNLLSSHAVKRFFKQMPSHVAQDLRAVLLGLFVKDLLLNPSTEILLDVDTVVYDNDDALQREGSTPTYKKVKGFQPLLVKWNGKVVWAEFREGSTHSNHGISVLHALKTVSTLIRNTLGTNTKITVTFDSGFFDQKIFTFMEKAEIGLKYVCSGKLYSDLREVISAIPAEDFKQFASANNDGVWEYVELKDRRASWDTQRRVVYTRRVRLNDGQIDLIGPESVYYTNLDNPAQAIITLAHGRGTAELVHRKLKDFASQSLPFQAFYKNEIWFFLMLIAFNVFELFKEVCSPTEISIAGMYPTTFRRRYFDIAGKIVRHAGETILKVTKATFGRLTLLWRVLIDFDYS